MKGILNHQLALAVILFSGKKERKDTFRKTRNPKANKKLFTNR